MKLSSTCPKCARDYSETEVIDSRTNRAGKRRRRQCKCGHRFTTLEVQVNNHERAKPLSGLLETLKMQQANSQRLIDAIVELIQEAPSQPAPEPAAQ